MISQKTKPVPNVPAVQSLRSTRTWACSKRSTTTLRSNRSKRPELKDEESRSRRNLTEKSPRSNEVFEYWQESVRLERLEVKEKVSSPLYRLNSDSITLTFVYITRPA